MSSQALCLLPHRLLPRCGGVLLVAEALLEGGDPLLRPFHGLRLGLLQLVQQRSLLTRQLRLPLGRLRAEMVQLATQLAPVLVHSRRL